MIQPLLVLLPLLGAMACPVDTVEVEDELAQLLAQVMKEEDKVDVSIFGRIAEFKTAASLQTLKLAVEPLESSAVIFRAYLAFSKYRGTPELEAEAIEFLYSAACNHTDEDNQRLAAQGLTYFHAPAYPTLERLVREHPSDAVRKMALQPIIPRLGESGTLEDARLILDFATIRGGRSGQNVSEALAACKGVEVDRLLAERFRPGELSMPWTEMLLDALASRSGAEVHAALLTALENESTLIRIRALEVFGARGDPEMYSTLRRFLRAKDGLERRQAIISVTGVAARERSWPRALKKYARSKHVAERMGAAAGLALLATPDAIEILHGLLEDKDWRVRLESISQLAGLRDRDSIGILIAAMDGETGRLRSSMARALRRITGQDHGTSAARWQEWWTVEGAGFVLPDLEVSLAAEAEREARRDSRVTVASFYGLPLISEQVIFVLDSSGSMQSPAGQWGRTQTAEDSDPEKTRLDVAKSELRGALERMSKDVHFNVIFFNTVVTAWHDQLVRRSDREVKSASGFARNQNAQGGTDIYGGLMKAFEDPTVDTIYLLSDGSPSSGEVVNPDQLRQHVLRANGIRKIQINCISIGQPSPFLRKLAEENDGAYTEAL